MAIHLEKPYKIIPAKYKRYETHYHLPAERSLVVPLRDLGTDASCDVRWEDDNGELKVMHNIVFTKENLIPLNPMLDSKLHELWEHYYARVN